jgi:plasmid stabilization system protein ParE
VGFIREASGTVAAEAFVERVKKACVRLAELPRSGRACHDLGWRLRRFPVPGYVVFFRPMRYGVEVVRLLHQSRDIDSEFPPKPKGKGKPPRKPVPPKVRKRKTG